MDNVGETVTLNVCQAGHTFHESKQVETEYGPWRIWDWERYMDFPGYCTGQDEVSKSIEITGWWEKPDTDRMLTILDEQRGLVLDFGSHIGWFAVQAAQKGCGVYAYDADPENVRLMGINYGTRTGPGLANLAVSTTWVGNVKVLPYPIETGGRVRFLKADVEGHEHEVIDLTRHLWQQRRIDFGLLEVSPIFENRDTIMAPSYADLVDELIGYGYRATVYKSEGDWEITGADCTFDQENVLFSLI